MSSFKPKAPSHPESFTILLPGIDPDALTASEQLLDQNNKEFHCFFNERKIHK
jgi:hypothetical protein